MNSIEMVEACLKMLKRNGFRPTSVYCVNGAIKVKGLEPLPPDPAETVDREEASELRSNAEAAKERLALLGLR